MKRIISERYQKALVTVGMGFRTEEDIKKNGLYIFTEEESKDLIEYINFLFNRNENILALKVKQTGYRSKHINIKSKLELNNFINNLKNIYQEYKEIWIVSSSIIECWRGRIFLSTKKTNDMIEIAYSNNDHILDNIDSTNDTPYACWKIESSSLQLFKTNLDKKRLQEVNFIIKDIFSKYSKNFKEIKEDLELLGVDAISLDVRANEKYDFHDFDVSAGDTKKIVNYYLYKLSITDNKGLK